MPPKPVKLIDFDFKISAFGCLFVDESDSEQESNSFKMKSVSSKGKKFI